MSGDAPALFVANSIRAALLGLPPRPWEVGGWLLGYWRADRTALVVTHATPPAGRGTRTGVWISGEGHRDRFDQAFSSTGGVVTFLGDWHTHPGGPTRPSARDERAARQLAEDADYETPTPLIAITAVPRWRRGRTQRETCWHLRLDDELKPVEPAHFDELPAAAEGVPTWPWPRSVFLTE